MNKRFKELRKSLGLTQTEFGEKVGVTPSAISKIESGENDASEATIRLICKTYHVNYLWLTEGEGPMMEELDADALVEKYLPHESEWAKSIVRAFARLPDSEWVALRDLVERIKKERHP